MPELNDPTQSTTGKLSRSTFIGASAAALALGGTLKMSGAAELQLGKFHDPIVSENDPAISIEQPKLGRPDGEIDSYAAYPRDASAKTAGIVVVQHIWGVDAQIRDVVRRFAKAGYVTIAPNLYSRLAAPNGDAATDFQTFRAVAEKLADNQVDGDIESGATWIRARVKTEPLHRPPKIGVAGFCMGGGIALRVAAKSSAFDAVAMWYGRVEDEYAKELKVPLLGSFGGRDTSIPVDGVRAFQKSIRVPNDIKIYPEAGHAFFDDQRSMYVASAASDAWSRTLAWFSKYLAP